MRAGREALSLYLSGAAAAAAARGAHAGLKLTQQAFAARLPARSPAHKGSGAGAPLQDRAIARMLEGSNRRAPHASALRPLPRTNRTRLVPPRVLTGHAPSPPLPFPACPAPPTPPSLRLPARLGVSKIESVNNRIGRAGAGGQLLPLRGHD